MKPAPPKRRRLLADEEGESLQSRTVWLLTLL